MQQKTCLTQKELARRWTISHRTLERWRWAGEGPSYMKLGGRVVYRLEDILAFEKDQPAHRPMVAAHAVPWPGELAVFRSPSSDSFTLLTTFSSRPGSARWCEASIRARPRASISAMHWSSIWLPARWKASPI